MLTKSKVIVDLPAVDVKRAREFYEEKLGLKAIAADMSGPNSDVMYQAGGDTRIYVYQRAATKADHTVASFEVDNLDKEMQELKSKGIKFEDYDMPGLKTVNGVFSMDSMRVAWFKDTEGNILALSQKMKK